MRPRHLAGLFKYKRNNNLSTGTQSANAAAAGDGGGAMLHTVDGGRLAELLEGGFGDPRRFEKLLLCSPFIDEYGREILARLGRVRVLGGPMVTVVTTPATAAGLTVDGVTVRAVSGLHAKLYAAIG